MINARYLALKILLSLNKTLYIQSALDMFLNKYNLSDKDKGLCTELVYGYLRNEIRIKYILNSFLKNTKNIPEEMFITLGISVYAIFFLTKTPDYASVNWAVEHTKDRFNLKLSKVTNAVLRNIIRQYTKLNSISFYAENASQTKSDLNVLHSELDAHNKLDANTVQSDFNSHALYTKLDTKDLHSKLDVRTIHGEFATHVSQDEFAVNTLQNELDANVFNREFDAHALFYSMPTWIANLWKNYYGEKKTIELMENFSCKPNVGIRLNFKHKDFEIVKNALHEAHGLILNDFGVMFESGKVPKEIHGVNLKEYFKDGLFSYQSAGSILAVDAMTKFNYVNSADKLEKFDYRISALNAPIWDMCAGQGGKTCALLERGFNVKLATDVNFNRLKLLENNIIRLKLPMPSIALVDKNHSSIQKWNGTILIDAPCSGLGILHRRPDIKRIKSYDDMQGYARVQRELLISAWNKLEINNNILYVTCTINPLENQIQIRNFLKEQKSATLLHEWQSNFSSFLCEGMYVAVIKKYI